MTDSDKLDVILTEIIDMKTDIRDMKTDIQGVKAEMQGMKSDIQNISLNTRMDSLEFQIKSTERVLRNQITKSETLILGEVERVHLKLTLDNDTFENTGKSRFFERRTSRVLY